MECPLLDSKLMACAKGPPGEALPSETLNRVEGQHHPILKGLETKSRFVVEENSREYRVPERGCPQNSGRGITCSRNSAGQEGRI
jgi:hypothetical protein